MKISFFVESNEFDNTAVTGGVFAIEAINTENGKTAMLYIRESSCMAESASRVLKQMILQPEYLGLSKGVMGSDALLIQVRVLDRIRVRKTFSTLGVYRDAEVTAIKKYKPLTQQRENHYFISEKKREELVRAELDM